MARRFIFENLDSKTAKEISFGNIWAGIRSVGARRANEEMEAVRIPRRASIAVLLVCGLLTQFLTSSISAVTPKGGIEKETKRYRPELVVQTGHTEPPVGIAFSPDGKLLASASRREVLIWDIQSGRQLRSLTTSSSTQGFEYVAFSPNGSEIATFRSREAVEFWDVWTGERKRVVGNLETVEGVRFTADWSRFVTIDSFELAVWDTKTLQKLSSIEAEPTRDEAGRVLKRNQLFPGSPFELSISPDGTRAAVFPAGFLFSSARPKNEELPFPVSRLFDLTRMVESGSFQGIFPTFAPDSSMIAYYSENGLKLREVSTGKIVRSISATFPEDAFPGIKTPIVFGRDASQLFFLSDGTPSVRGLSLKSGKEFEPVPGRDVLPWGVAVDSNGTRLAMSGVVTSGNPLAELNNLPATSGEKRKLFGELRRVLVWDVKDGSLISTLSGRSNDAPVQEEYVEISNDKRFAAFNSFSGTVLWDFQKGRALAYGWQKTSYDQIRFAPDSKSIVVGGESGVRNGLPVSFGNDRIVRSYDLNNGELLWKTEMLPQDIASIDFSPKGDTIAVSYTTYFEIKNGQIDRGSGGERKVSFLDPKTGAIQREIRGLPDSVYHLAFSPDGRYLLLKYRTPYVADARGIFLRGEDVSEASRTIEIWSIDRLRKITVIGDTDPFTFGRTTSSFSPNGRFLAVLQTNELSVWDLQTFQKVSGVSRYQEVGVQDREFINNIAFSADSSEVIGEDYREQIEFRLDLGSGKVAVKSADPKGCIDRFHKLVRLGKDLQRVLISGPLLELVDCAAATKKLRMIALGNEDWAVVTPSGYFDATEKAMESMHFVVADPKTGYEVIELDQLKSRFYVPGLYAKLAAGEVVGSSADFTVTLSPSIQLRRTGDSNTFRLEASDRGGGIGRVEVRVNGSELFADLRRVNGASRGPGGEFEFAIPSDVLRPGDNPIEVIGWNEEGDVRGRGVKGVAKVKGTTGDYEPRFFAIVGGVSDYAGNDIDLRFADKDAEDMAAALALGAGKLLCGNGSGQKQQCERVEIYLLSTGKAESGNSLLRDGRQVRRLTPTKENFRKAFEEVSAKAGPGDILVIYLAGHAVAIRSVNALEESGFADLYLYATRDATTLDRNRLQNESERAGMISSLELAEWMRRSKAEKEVMILDTCAAGTASRDLSSTIARDGSAEQVKALDRLRERTGFYLLMGSASDSVSYEANRFRQGLLTYSLLEAMSGAALRDGEFVDVEDLFGYAEDRVEELAAEIGGVQKPSYFKSSFAKRFDIGRLDSIARQRIPLAPPVPVVSQPQILDRESLFDSIGLSEMLAAELRALSVIALRGGETASINFVPVTRISGGLTPSGLYGVDGDLVSVEIALRKDGNLVDRIKVSGSRKEIAAKLARAIIASANSQFRQ